MKFERSKISRKEIKELLDGALSKDELEGGFLDKLYRNLNSEEYLNRLLLFYLVEIHSDVMEILLHTFGDKRVRDLSVVDASIIPDLYYEDYCNGKILKRQMEEWKRTLQLVSAIRLMSPSLYRQSMSGDFSYAKVLGEPRFIRNELLLQTVFELTIDRIEKEEN